MKNRDGDYFFGPLAALGGAPAEPGVCYLVGAGPGDPSLSSLRAAHLVATADLLVFDALAPRALLALACPDAELCDVGKRGGGRKKAEQEAIEKMLIEAARAGRAVVRLKGGDPFVFGRGGEEAAALAKAGVPFEVVPGITSAIAAPAYAGIPVTHRGLAACATIATGHEGYGKKAGFLDWEALARGGGTIVLLMSHATMRKNLERIVRAGRPPETPAAAVEWGTTNRQRVVRGTLGDLAGAVEKAGLAAPIVFVIGEVVSALAREGAPHAAGWFAERRPLLGKRILVTRARPQASELSARLSALGAEVVEAPAIRIVPLDPAPFEAALSRLSDYDGVLFTSPRAVEIAAERLFSTGRDARAFSRNRIFAIGPATAEALRAIGLVADGVPEKYVAEALLELVMRSDDGLAGKRFLLPRAEEARDVLPRGLREAGAEVDVVPIYRAEADPNGPARLAQALEEGLDLATFTASSTVTRLLEGLDGATRRRLLALPACVIGPITAEAARKAGFARVEVAEEATIASLVERVRAAFEARTARRT